MDDLSALAQWEHAMTRLRALFDQHGSEAYQQVANYSRRYQGRRAEMVFDVVASRRRDSDLPVAEAFVRTPAASSLRALAEQGPGTNSLRHHLRPGERRGSSFMGYGLRSGEGRTIQAVASGLVRFAAERDLDDDEATTRAWAASAAPYECTPQLEPYVGLVKGIGPVHFASMRMLSGADALRPNSRVRTSLNRLGFQVPSDEQAILIVAHAAAAELGVSRLILDQLLWWEVTEESLRPPSDLVGRQADPPGPGSTDLVTGNDPSGTTPASV
jgi:hypothetical protein